MNRTGKKISLNSYRVIFWDFDGVIKDSVSAKTEAYLKLFEEYGSEVQQRVKEHHGMHGGVSRLEKIPYYFLEYLGRELSSAEIEKYCSRFSELCFERVIASSYIPGAEEYIRKNHKIQKFYIITGTPQEEIELILQRLDLKSCFQDVYGSPRTKKKIIQNFLETIEPDKAGILFIGDATTDFEAAEQFGIDFLLRETPESAEVFRNIDCERVHDFLSFI